MRISIYALGNKSSPNDPMVCNFLERCGSYLPSTFQRVKLFSVIQKAHRQTAPYFILLDSRGRQMSSEAFAQTLGKLRDEGKREVVFAIGPADGWTEAERRTADLLLSLSSMTLPHEMAALILSEQIWRACAILTNHPYHAGHK